jgi:SAM-dependent methyltransferase
MEEIRCPSCDGVGLEVFHRVSYVPTNSCILLGTKDEATEYPRGDIDLAYCRDCGFITNTRFDPRLTEYSGRYEETQGFSETFNVFHMALAERLIEQYDLRGKTVLEIGCGKGEFLALLCRLGGNRGIGFDPGYIPGRLELDEGADVHVIRDYYSEKYAEHRADFVCCKMTLEHIPDVGAFVSTVRRAVGDDAVPVFFQIPNADRILEEGAFEDIYYEHCSYFTADALKHLFERCGFSVLSLGAEYDNQYLTIECVTGGDWQALNGQADSEHLSILPKRVEAFRDKFEEKRTLWQQRLSALAELGSRVVLWGSGSKGVAFLSAMNIHDEIEYVVDINPYRVGAHMPGSGHPIVSPEFLSDYRPDAVILMNRIYKDEVQQTLAAQGLYPSLLEL